MSKHTFQHGEYKPHKNFYEIYHGCRLANEDGIRTLIKKYLGGKCKFTTSNHFWKLPKDVGSRVETRIMEMRKTTASKRCIKKYFQSFNQSINQ